MTSRLRRAPVAKRGPPYAGRRRPYTTIGIRRMACSRCGQRATQQWAACANGNRYVPVCDACDVALNAVALDFMRVPNRGALMALYRAVMDEVARRDA